jgi:hypothetical protein
MFGNHWGAWPKEVWRELDSAMAVWEYKHRSLMDFTVI